MTNTICIGCAYAVNPCRIQVKEEDQDRREGCVGDAHPEWVTRGRGSEEWKLLCDAFVQQKCYSKPYVSVLNTKKSITRDRQVDGIDPSILIL